MLDPTMAAIPEGVAANVAMLAVKLVSRLRVVSEAEKLGLEEPFTDVVGV